MQGSLDTPHISSENIPMKVLILSINYWPEVTGIGAFTISRAEYLAAAGHEVEVCTTFPYYPEWKVTAQYAGKFAATEERNGVRIIRSYAYIPTRVTSLKRVLHEASFIATSLLRALGRKRPDVLLVVSPPLGLAVSAILLGWLWRIPYVFDVEDLQPDSAADLGMLPPLVLKLMYRVEAAAYRYAALVSTITDGMRERILKKGVPPEKVTLFEARLDSSLLDLAPEEGTAFRQRYDLGDKFLVTHSGNMGVKQGLDVIVDAAVLGRADGSTQFLLVGSGVDRERIQNRVADLGLENVRFFPLLDEADFRGLLAATNICLVTQQKAASDIFFPSKMVTYLAAGRPLIASVDSGSQAARVTRESGAGRTVVPEDPGALLRAVHEMRTEDLRAYGAKARDYAISKWAPARVLGYLEQTLASVAFMPAKGQTEEGAIRR